MLNWSPISMWLTSCHNPQEGPWAPWSNIHYPSSTMAARGCPSQMKPSASSICTHFVHYSWAKNNPSLHLLPRAPQLLTHHLLQFLSVFAYLYTIILSLCLIMLSQHLSTLRYLCVAIHKANSLSGPVVCVTESVCGLVSCVFQRLNKNGDCITSQLIKQPFQLHQSARLHVSVCVCVSIY